jgi:SAM-dependent methyltransferase
VNWRVKALCQLGLSVAPLGETANYYAQRYVTGNAALSYHFLRILKAKAANHIDAMHSHLAVPLSQAVVYQFGAGWELGLPLLLWALGVDHQILADRRCLVRIELVNDVVNKLGQMYAELRLCRQPKRELESDLERALATLRECYGIDYRAPLDAASTGFGDGTIDCVIAYDTLEHIPQRELKSILEECRRVLKPDGAMIFKVDYQDHYSFSDENISAYNFLRYSDRTWRLFNPYLHYQNRLRHPDYVAAFKDAGLETLQVKKIGPTGEDLRQVQELGLAAGFRHYPLDELAVRGAVFVLRPNPSSPQVTT